jgi:hypothetical protein
MGKVSAANPPVGKTKKKTKKVRLTQEQIDSYIWYQMVHMSEDALPRVTEERLALAKLKDWARFPPDWLVGAGVGINNRGSGMGQRVSPAPPRPAPSCCHPSGL